MGPIFTYRLFRKDIRNLLRIAGNNKDFTFPLKADAKAEIKVENNNYTLSVNGSQLQTISISGYDSGGFRLGLYCRGYPQCPSF